MDTTATHKKPGITGYSKQRCRCEECRAAAAEYAVKYRKDAREVGTHITPGLAGYIRGCRCDLCRAGKREARKKYQSPAARAHAAKYSFEKRSTPEARAAKARYDQARHKLIYRPSEARRERLWKVYKITPEQYQDMFEAQNGVCKICGNEPGKHGLLAIDHDHSCCPSQKVTCGKCIRGLLCWPCNSFLGRIADDPKALNEYLAR